MFRTILKYATTVAVFGCALACIRQHKDSNAAWAQEPSAKPATEQTSPGPAYSLEAIEINGQPIPGGPVSRISIAPGDKFTMKAMLRDWSPAGQKLRGYQLMMDADSYKSGSAGAVQPIDYNAVPDNAKNCFIDKKDPNYIQRDLDSIPVVDASSPNYRLMNVVLEGDQGPIGKQDGKKYVAGTLKMNATEDARGQFTIKISPNPDATSLLTPGNQAIEPLRLEPLIVEVAEKTGQNRIVSTDPPNGAIDARRVGKDGKTWDSVQLKLGSAANGVTASDFTVEDGTPAPPKVLRVTADGPVLMLTLDHPIRVGAWTAIVYPRGGSVRIAALPGDVNNDGEADSNDVAALIETLNGGPALPLYRMDIDRDGALTPRDLSALVDLLGSPSPTPSRLRK